MLERPIFLGGVPRSGLTLLRAILDSHPRLSAGPDAWLAAMALTERDIGRTLGELLEGEFSLDASTRRSAFATAISAILGGRAVASGKARTVEKSPLNLLTFADLAALFPDAQLVHVTRDGRDVAASLLERAWKDPRSGKLLPQCASAAGAGKYWADLAGQGLAMEASLQGRIMRLRYEDIVADPAGALSRLTAFFGETYTDDLLAFHARPISLEGMEKDSAAALTTPLHASRVGRFRRDLDSKAIASIEAVAGSRLAALGYA